MSQEMKRAFGYVAVALLLVVGIGCSVDSPTTPIQEAQPPSGSSPGNETWNIVLKANPDSISVGGGSRLDVVVRDSAGNWPANGTLIRFVVNRGNFRDDLGNLTPDTLRAMTRGETSAEFVAENLARESLSGDFRVTAILDSSDAIELITTDGGPVVAAFSFVQAGSTVAFNNTSTGNITSFRWEFGDGSTSSAVEPTHTYGEEGEYLVTLTATGPGGSDSTSLAITIGGEPTTI